MSLSLLWVIVGAMPPIPPPPVSPPIYYTLMMIAVATTLCCVLAGLNFEAAGGSICPLRGHRVAVNMTWALFRD